MRILLILLFLAGPAWGQMLHATRPPAAAAGGCTVDTTTEAQTSGVSGWDMESTSHGWMQSITYGGGAKDFKQWDFEVVSNENAGTTTVTCRLDDDVDPSADSLVEWTCNFATGVTGWVECTYSGSYELSTGTYYVACLSDAPNWSNRWRVGRNSGDANYDGTGYYTSTGWSGFAGQSVDVKFKFGYCQ